MDSPDNARSEDARTQCIRDAYLLGRIATQVVSSDWARRKLGPARFTKLVEAAAEGDRSVTAAFLRGWGVW